MRTFSINFSELIYFPGQESLYGVTKLRNEIYVLSQYDTGLIKVIRVFEDRNPFRLLEKIEVNEFRSILDIRSNEKENCIYVADGRRRCVWKITIKTADQHKIIKWLKIDYALNDYTLSVSCLGNLLIASKYLSHLNIYGSDADRRSIPLPRGIRYPIHAVETSIGNFIVLHEWRKTDDERAFGNIRRVRLIQLTATEYTVSELTKDGKMVIRRFIPSNEIQKLIYPCYLALDPDDQVFVADSGKDRVVLLDSDLNWNRILCPTKEEEGIKTHFQRICYDDEKKQLIGTGHSHLGLSVYTLSHK